MVGAAAAGDNRGQLHLARLAGEGEDQSGLSINGKWPGKPGRQSLLANLVASATEDDLAEIGEEQEVKIGLEARGPVLEVANVVHVVPT